MAPLTDPGRRRLQSAPVYMSSLALMAVSAGLLVSALIEAGYGDPEVVPLLVSAGAVGAIGVAGWQLSAVPRRVRAREAFVAVTAVWVAIAVAGAVPYVLSGMLRDWELALFESVAGFTTTGATVLAPIEGHGHGLLFFRQLTQWYGGMGMIVLAIAVLPYLGVGGMELLRAEAPGPDTDKLTPRISETAKRLWFVYVLLTLAAALGLLAVGVGPYDAVTHALSGISTGGFSPHDASISYFDSVAVEIVVILTMFVGAVNFALIWVAIRFRSLTAFLESAELRFYVRVLVVAIGFIAVVLVGDGVAIGSALRRASFIVVSIMSTCGFGTADFAQWPAATQLVLLFLMVSGGMAGSTSGGVKVFRVQVMMKHAAREVRRIRHPRGVFPIRLGDVPIPERIVGRILAFLTFYVVLAALGVVVLAMLGADLTTAAGSIASAMGSIGPGLGETGPASNFLTLNAPQRLVMDLYMLFGRLEIFPVLIAMLALAPRGSRPRELR